jgi:acetoin utilization protein AcuB
MFVKYWMTKDVITVDLNDSMQEAIHLLKSNNIRMLPVMRHGKIVGIVTDRDLKRHSASEANTLDIHELLYVISKIKVKQIMTRDPITVPPDLTVEETAEILLKNKISGVPVVDDWGQLVGIITQADLFRVLVSLTGVDKMGIQFAFLVKDRPGSIKEVMDIIRMYNGRAVSILTSYERAAPGYRTLYIRAYQLDRKSLPQLQEELQEKATLLYMVDHRHKKRIEFPSPEITD